MSVGFAYRTDDAEVVALIRGAEEAVREYYAAAEALHDSLPDGCHVMQWSWGRSKRVTGVRAPATQEGMPEGWRYYVKPRQWEPDRRGPNYKEIVGALPRVSEPRYPGLPVNGIDISRGSRTYLMTPTPILVGETAWIGADGRLGRSVIGEPWVVARYSEYVRALEDAEADA